MKIRKQNQHLLLDADSNGKFLFEMECSRKFLLTSIINVFEHIIMDDEQLGIELATALIGGLLASNKIGFDKILKELNSFEED